MNEWTNTMYMTMKTVHPITWVIYLLVIFIGGTIRNSIYLLGIFCFNLVIAVLKMQYRETTNFYSAHPIEHTDRKQVALNLRILKDTSTIFYH
jgi:uncharacterized membrane protein YccC